MGHRGALGGVLPGGGPCSGPILCSGFLSRGVQALFEESPLCLHWTEREGRGQASGTAGGPQLQREPVARPLCMETPTLPAL